MPDFHIKTTITKQPKSEVLIEGEIPADVILKLRPIALKKLQGEVHLDGFRKGHVPETVIIQKLGEHVILEEAAEMALQEKIAPIIEEHKLNPLGRPQVVLHEAVPEKPVRFSLRLAVMPEVKLAAYRELAKKEMSKAEEAIEVSEKEVDNVVEEVRKIAGREAKHAELHSKGEPHSHDEHEHTDIPNEELPPLSDDFVKKLGDFKNVSDFREKIKKNLTEDKTTKAKEKKRLSLLEDITKNSEIDVPLILMESELERMMSQWEHDLERMGVRPEDYLKHVKKTEAELRKEWEKDAEKRAKVQLILNGIAAKEKLTPSPEEIKKEVDRILEHYPTAKRENVQVYAETIITNEKVLAFLESQK